MRILHLVHQYLPERIGGTELYTRTLAHHQVEQGHSVAVFSPSTLGIPPGSDQAQPDVERSVRIYRIPVGQRSPARVFGSTFGHRLLRHAFKHVLNQEQPDIVHIQHLMGLPVDLVDDIHEAQIPFLVTLHDYWYLCANAQLYTNYDHTVCGGPKWWINCARCAMARVDLPGPLPLLPAIAPLFAVRHAKLRQVLTKAEKIIAPTAFVRQIYTQASLPPEKIEVVAHGIRLPELMPPRKSSDSELHVAYIGGLSWQKGVHVLVEAFGQLDCRQARLSIMGDVDAFPDYVSQLKAIARDAKIAFMGRLEHTKLWQTLAGIDLIVVPSLWYETSSLIIQEAFAARVPVVASDIGALQEKIRDGVDGILVPAGDVNAWHDVMAHVCSDPSVLGRLRMGIQPVGTIDGHLQILDRLYRQIIEQSSANRLPR